MKVKRLIVVLDNDLKASAGVLGIRSPADAAGLGQAFLQDTQAAGARPEVGADVRLAAQDATPGTMQGWFETAFAEGYGAVCIVSSRAPHLPSSFLQEAFGRLAASPVTGAGVDMVWGPADGGGCTLLAARRLLAELPPDAASPDQITTARLETQMQASGIGYHLLPRWYDIRTASDLRRLRLDLRRQVVYAPHTAKVLERLSF